MPALVLSVLIGEGRNILSTTTLQSCDESLSEEKSIMAQQGIQGGGDRPEPTVEGREAPSAKQMESLGAARVRNENEANRHVVQKLQETTNNIKDYVAEKMDNASAAMKTAFVSGEESAAERSRDSVQG